MSLINRLEAAGLIAEGRAPTNNPEDNPAPLAAPAPRKAPAAISKTPPRRR